MVHSAGAQLYVLAEDEDERVINTVIVLPIAKNAAKNSERKMRLPTVVEEFGREGLTAGERSLGNRRSPRASGNRCTRRGKRQIAKNTSPRERPLRLPRRVQRF